MFYQACTNVILFDAFNAYGFLLGGERRGERIGAVDVKEIFGFTKQSGYFQPQTTKPSHKVPPVVLVYRDDSVKIGVVFHWRRRNQIIGGIGFFAACEC